MILDTLVETLANLSGYTQAWYNGDPLPGQSVDTATKIKVDNDVALTYSACWAATQVLSDPISLMPLCLYRREADGGREEVRDHPLYEILHNSPNDEMGSMAFRGCMTPQLVNRGNAFAEIERRGSQVRALWPIHVTRLQDGDGRLRIYRDKRDRIGWLVKNDDGTDSIIPDEDMFNIVGAMSDDGICGKGVIRQAAESIGLGIATERFGGTFFGNGARPSIVLTHPTKLAPDGKQNLRREWNATYGGPNNQNKAAILEGGTTLTAFSIANNDAQFLETRQYNVQEICRWYRVQPHQLADLSRATFSNIEHLALEFVTYSLMPWIGRWEEAIRRKLFTQTERAAGLYAEFNVEGLLRGDSVTRSNFYKTMLGIGVFNINTILGKENMEGIGENGEVRFIPANMITLDKAIQQEPNQAGNDPNMPENDGENGDSEGENDQETPPKGPGDDQAGSRLTAVIATNLTRLTTKLRNHSLRLALKPADFCGWVDDSLWWTTFTESVSASIGSNDEAEAWVAQHRAEMNRLTNESKTAEALSQACAAYYERGQ